MRNDWDDLDDHHPACRCGCGELADECAGPRPAPLGSMTVVDFDDHDYRPTCAWRGCALDAEYGRLCDVHVATL